MANRTNPEAVQTLLGYANTVDVSTFITAANQAVTGVCVPLGYTDLELEVIERYLAAYFAVGGTVAGLKKRQKIGQAEDEFSDSKANSFLQQLYLVDYKGGISTLIAMSEKGMRQRRVGVVHVGDRRCQPPDQGFKPLPSQTTAEEVRAYSNGNP